MVGAAAAGIRAAERGVGAEAAVTAAEEDTAATALATAASIPAVVAADIPVAVDSLAVVAVEEVVVAGRRIRNSKWHSGTWNLPYPQAQCLIGHQLERNGPGT